MAHPSSPKSTILSCRPEGRGGALHRALHDAGFEVVRLPLVQVAEPADGGAALRSRLDRLAEYRWIACTSVAAVEALGSPPSGPLPSVAAVGASTAEAFERLGWSVELVASSPSASGLAADFPVGDGRVLAPLGELANDDLTAALVGKGWRVDSVVAYRTVLPAVEPSVIERASACAAVVVSAPSVAVRLAQVLDALPRLAVSYGQRSAAAARDVGFSRVIVATPDPGDIVTALRTALDPPSSDR